MCCISVNSEVDVKLVSDEATEIALSSEVVTCSRWDNEGGMISITGDEGGRFTGDEGPGVVKEAASLLF